MLLQRTVVAVNMLKLKTLVRIVYISVVTIPNVAMRYVSRYLGHDAIRIAILVYRVSQCLDLQQKNKNNFFIVNTPESF